MISVKNISLFIYTVKYLKFRQIFWRLIYKFPRIKTSFSPIKTQINYSLKLKFIKKSGITNDLLVFKFLNQTYKISDIGWNNKSVPKLWMYNLHYFDYLSEPDIGLLKKSNYINNWIKENDNKKYIAWDPYPTSVRIINWLKWQWEDGQLTDYAINSLWFQLNWLNQRPEFHLLGNHLFVNSKALIFGSVFFGLDESHPIYRKGLKILNDELNEQFLLDGAHFELSPMYHSLALEDLLDLYNLATKISTGIPKDRILTKINLAFTWLEQFVYKNNELAHFNDCSNGIASTYSNLISYAHSLNINIDNSPKVGLFELKESGFYVYRTNQIHLITDFGNIGPDYLPGHAHADSLSFELSIKNHRVIVNSGTGEYGLSNERIRQRSTESHSTVEIDGESSSLVWSGFRVAQRARILNFTLEKVDNELLMSASHNGYTRLQNSPLHYRKFKITRNCIQIMDEVSGKNNKVLSRFYLHPDILVIEKDNYLLLYRNNLFLCKLKSTILPNVIETTYYDSFGISKKNKCLVFSGKTPYQCGITLTWDDEKDNLSKLLF